MLPTPAAAACSPCLLSRLLRPVVQCPTVIFPPGPPPRRQLILSTDEDRADIMGGKDVSDYLAAFDRLRERWGAGGCAPKLQERVLGLVDDLREFGHI